MVRRSTAFPLLLLLALPILPPALDASSDGAASDTSAGFAQQWPQWRGPLGTGVAPYGDPPATWSETENVCWKVELPGRGHASPIIWGDRLFVLTAVEEEADTESGSDEAEGRSESTRPAVVPVPGGGTRFRPRGVQPEAPVRFMVLALDRNTGEVVWERLARTAVPHEGTHRTATWASASAATDGEVLVASFGSNGIYAYALDGRELWQRDLGDQQTRNAFGEGSSPVIHGSTVVVNWDHEGESFIVALNRDTGETLWRRERDEPTSWSTPLVIEVDGRAQVVVNATNRIRAYDLATGDVVWHVGGMTTNAIPTPGYAEGLVYVMSGFRGSNLLAIRVAGASGDLDGTDHVVWSHDRDTSYTPSGLLYEDTYYFLKSNNAILTSVHAETGEVFFGPERLAGIDGAGGVYASPVGAAGRVYIAGQNGVTLVLRRGPELEILATNALDDAFDASPAIAGDEIFLRGRKYLYCLGSRADSGQTAKPQRENIESLAWLAGSWLGDSGEESWLAPLGGTMLGVNRGPDRDDRQPAFEFLRIVEQDGGLAFLASPSGRFPPVAFAATEVGEARVVFANPEHDFPQRITYWLDDTGTLRARVEALQEGEWRGFENSWQRAAAPQG